MPVEVDWPERVNEDVVLCVVTLTLGVSELSSRFLAGRRLPSHLDNGEVVTAERDEKTVAERLEGLQADDTIGSAVYQL